MGERSGWWRRRGLGGDGSDGERKILIGKGEEKVWFVSRRPGACGDDLASLVVEGGSNWRILWARKGCSGSVEGLVSVAMIW